MKSVRKHYSKTKIVRARIVRALAKSTKHGRGRIKNRRAYKTHVLKGRYKKR